MRTLTARQRQVLLHAANGKTNMQIGRLLGIDPQTVNRRLVAAYAALGARDRANAVALAIHHGEITLAELARIAGANQPREQAA